MKPSPLPVCTPAGEEAWRTAVLLGSERSVQRLVNEGVAPRYVKTPSRPTTVWLALYNLNQAHWGIDGKGCRDLDVLDRVLERVVAAVPRLHRSDVLALALADRFDLLDQAHQARKVRWTQTGCVALARAWLRPDNVGGDLLTRPKTCAWEPGRRWAWLRALPGASTALPPVAVEAIAQWLSPSASVRRFKVPLDRVIDLSKDPGLVPPAGPLVLEQLLREADGWSVAADWMARGWCFEPFPPVLFKSGVNVAPDGARRLAEALFARGLNEHSTLGPTLPRPLPVHTLSQALGATASQWHASWQAHRLTASLPESGRSAQPGRRL